jgi:uncharacterized Zn finger protein (UPF0148 family)
LICPNCGTQLPDNAAYCYKCGTAITANAGQGSRGSYSGQSGAPSGQSTSSQATKPQEVIAPSGVTSIKCPNCGAPLTPKFGEMVITCEYCGSGVTLGNQGWSHIQNQTMLPLKIANSDDLVAMIKPLMDKGLMHRHLQEDSKQEEVSLSYVPYWIVSVSARTTVVATNEAAQIGQVATTAALMGIIFGGMGGGGGGGFGGGGRRRALGSSGTGTGGLSLAAALRSVRLPIMMWGMGMGMGGGGMVKSEQMDANYNFPVIALKGLTDYQPANYEFDLDGRTLFDINKLPKGVKILNGDIGEDVAKSQAKTLVDQLQSQKAHAKYHMIRSITTDSDVGDVELLHAPIWFAKYDHKGTKVVLVVDANSGRVINSMGL